MACAVYPGNDSEAQFFLPLTEYLKQIYKLCKSEHKHKVTNILPQKLTNS